MTVIRRTPFRAVQPALLALAAVALAPGAAAQPARMPRELGSELDFQHMMRDMMTVFTRHYQVRVRLDIAPDGTAALALQGRATFTRVDVPTSGPGEPAVESAVEIDEVWSGTAHRAGRDVVIRFRRSTAYRPAIDVDVEWTCTPGPVNVGADTVSAWRCATEQMRTRPSGPGHYVTEYMRVPMVLAALRERLSARVRAGGGADHRVTSMNATYARTR